MCRNFKINYDVITSIAHSIVTSSQECKQTNPDSKVHGANMGLTWVLSAPDGHHVGPINLACRVSKARCWCEEIVFLIFIYGLIICCVRNRIISALLSWTVHAFIWVFLWCLFPLIFCNVGNRHQNNLLNSKWILATPTHTLSSI